MATRVEELIVKVRDVLSDEEGNRWSEAMLLRLMQSGVNDFLLRTKCSKSVLYIAVEDYVSTYKIQDFSQAILRVQYLDTALVAKTMSEMDTIDPVWPSTKGQEPKFVIFENLPAGTFKIYPKVPSATTNVVEVNSNFGGLIDLEVTDDLVLLPSVEDISETIDTYLVVTYIKKQVPITRTSEIYIDRMYDDALVYYITGMALRADADTQNRAFGNEQLAMYDSYLKLAAGNESVDNHTLTPREVSYKGFV